VVLDDGSVITTPRFVNAAGPMAGAVASLSGVDLPLVSEAHHKVAFRDHLAAIPRTAPMMIWCDPQRIDWSPEEAEMLDEAGRGDLSTELPAFCHGRPEGGEESTWVLALWEHTRKVMEPTWPMTVDDLHAEVVIRGMSRMIPRLSDYSGRLPQSVIDGGYYTKAPDNLPVLGPVGPQGVFICAGLSGYGIMAAPAAGEALARHLVGEDVPAWADRFHPSRLFDPAYLEGIDRSDAGQL
jgi:glycine/D-amino acid oxidase-like deaminating enzyme